MSSKLPDRDGPLPQNHQQPPQGYPPPVYPYPQQDQFYAPPPVYGYPQAPPVYGYQQQQQGYYGQHPNYYQGGIMAPPQQGYYGQSQQQSGGWLQGCLTALCCCCMMDECFGNCPDPTIYLDLDLGQDSGHDFDDEGFDVSSHTF